MSMSYTDATHKPALTIHSDAVSDEKEWEQCFFLGSTVGKAVCEENVTVM